MLWLLVVWGFCFGFGLKYYQITIKYRKKKKSRLGFFGVFLAEVVSFVTYAKAFLSSYVVWHLPGADLVCLDKS